PTSAWMSRGRTIAPRLSAHPTGLGRRRRATWRASAVFPSRASWAARAVRAPTNSRGGTSRRPALAERLSLAMSPRAFLGVSLDQFLRQYHETEQLGPFRDNVTDDLSPLALGVHPGIEHDPADSGDHEEDAEGMVAQPVPEGAQEGARRTAALGGAPLLQVF